MKLDPTLVTLHKTLRAHASNARAKTFVWFFKTGPGEYGEGDQFLGLSVPYLRQVAKAHKTLPLASIIQLLCSPWHEERLLALLLLVQRMRSKETEERTAIYELYLKHTRFINNWDLVDSSAAQIVGSYLAQQSAATARKTLNRLARSSLLWERRIAMIATYHWIQQGQSKPALTLAKQLLKDKHDLIHKAVGWMLREVGKRCSEKTLCSFLDTHGADMPRTALRYAIERLPFAQRKQYLETTRPTPARHP